MCEVRAASAVSGTTLARDTYFCAIRAGSWTVLEGSGNDNRRDSLFRLCASSRALLLRN